MKYLIITENQNQGFVESLLVSAGAYGSENAVRTPDLLSMSGIRDKRGLQHLIEKERSAGAVICSKCRSGGGYYLPSSKSEIVDYERTLTSRALGTLRSLRSARRALKIMDGQTQLDEGEV